MISLFIFFIFSVIQLFNFFGSCTSFAFKTFHRKKSFYLAIPLRRQKEELLIRELGTATTYGCNDKIERISIITCPCCRSVNVINISYSTLWHSHGDMETKERWTLQLSVTEMTLAMRTFSPLYKLWELILYCWWFLKLELWDYVMNHFHEFVMFFLNF